MCLLSEHNGGRLICHYCGYEADETEQVCFRSAVHRISADLRPVPSRLKKVVQDSISQRARILRMDLDTTRDKGRL